jgi:hypothetical protein
MVALYMKLRALDPTGNSSLIRSVIGHRSSPKKLRNIFKMLDYTHFAALGHLYALLSVVTVTSSRSCRGRELPVYHRSSTSINSGGFLNLIYQKQK